RRPGVSGGDGLAQSGSGGTSCCCGRWGPSRQHELNGSPAPNAAELRRSRWFRAGTSIQLSSDVLLIIFPGEWQTQRSEDSPTNSQHSNPRRECNRDVSEEVEVFEQ